jgi:Endonuclease/Exonuclease/phosphatase family
MPISALECLWWNVQDFAHFDPDRSAVKRWPESPEMYAEKMRRVIETVDAIDATETPDVIGLCEVTPQAARDLVTRRFPNHKIVYGQPDQPMTHQVVLLIRNDATYRDQATVFIRGGTAGSQPIVVSDVQTEKAHMRVFACHWTAFENESSEEMRGRAADSLREAIYEFLNPTDTVAVPRHVIVMGDFNEEPYHSQFELKLYAERHRDHARKTDHHTDKAVSRTRLYSCGWRLMGEQQPHPEVERLPTAAGTIYSEKNKAWKTFDHVFVSGGLLGSDPPYLDEAKLRICTESSRLSEGRPAKFKSLGGTFLGLSDHYPIRFSIVLEEHS